MSALFPWKASRRWRILSIIGIAILLVVQLGSEAVGATALAPMHLNDLFWLFYTTYAFIALLFLGVGSLVWLYSFRRQPMVSALLFIFCCVMTLAFGTLSAPTLGNSLLIAAGSSDTALAVFFLLLLLLRFPVDIFAVLQTQKRRLHLLYTAIILLAILCLCAVIRNICFNLNIAISQWVTLLVQLYYALAGGACIGTVLYATRHSSSMRTQQQTRLFFVGTLLSFVPILVLTVIPTILHSHAAVDGTLSMLSLVFFPLSLAYALLRYQVLIFDTYIRKTVTWIVGGVCMTLLAYVLFAVGSLLVTDRAALLLAGLIGLGVTIAPVLWWAAAIFTERFFFPEARYYASMLKQFHRSQGQETFNLRLIAHALTFNTMTTLKAPEVCLFFLDEDAQMYTLVSPYREDRWKEQLTSLILEPMAATHSLSVHDGSVSIPVGSPLIAQMQQTRRPLFLEEAIPALQQQGSLSRYLSPRVAQEFGRNLLLAPVSSIQGQLIGILVVSERGDHQHYAGPELEVLQQLVRSSSAALETAHLYNVATRQQQRSAREIEQAFEQQRHLTAIKDELIIHMNHELRTPLTEVSGYLALLHEHSSSLDPALLRVFIEKAMHGADELLYMVDTILNAAQTGEAATPPPCTAVALDQVVTEELNLLDPQTVGQHRIQVQGIDQLEVRANTQSLRQVVRNLLSNAIKYSPDGSTITVSAIQDEANVSLCIKDEGAGIPPDELPLLFGKFVRLQRDMSGAIRGTGLGLYISKQLVEAMGGRIWVESSGIPGEGSAFYVTLNRVSSPQTIIRDMRNANSTSVEVPVLESAGDF